MGAHSAYAQVWTHDSTQKWNEQWEIKYADWFQKNVTTTWLQQTGFIFSNWSVDCAKFPFLTRLYFSYENHLEFAIVNSESKSQKISSLSSRWNEVAAGPLRVQAFAKEVLNHISTSTLPENTVLVSLTKNMIRPGLILAGDDERRHTWVIQKINPSGIPQLLYGTLPESDYLYQAYTFPPPQSAFPLGKLPTEKSGGLRRFKWPEDLFKKTESISYSSNDQTTGSIFKFESFFEQIQNEIKTVARNSDEEFGYILDDVCMKVRVRVNIIIDAGQALKHQNGKPFSEDQIDLYSTVKRDKDILLTFQKLNDTYNKWKPQLSKPNIDRYESILNPQWTTGDECLVSWANNRTEPLGAILQRFQSGLVSSKASDSFSLRWGEL
jgi:hypothetical protein